MLFIIQNSVIVNRNGDFLHNGFVIRIGMLYYTNFGNCCLRYIARCGKNFI